MATTVEEIQEILKLYHNWKWTFTQGSIDKESILEAIQNGRMTKVLFELPKDSQRLCATFCLKEDGKVGYDGRVKQEDVDKLLSEWKRHN